MFTDINKVGLAMETRTSKTAAKIAGRQTSQRFFFVSDMVS